MVFYNVGSLTGSLNCLFTCSITSFMPSILPSIASSFNSSPRPKSRVACHGQITSLYDMLKYISRADYHLTSIQWNNAINSSQYIILISTTQHIKQLSNHTLFVMSFIPQHLAAEQTSTAIYFL
jgi:hypothetical protein